MVDAGKYIDDQLRGFSGGGGAYLQLSDKRLDVTHEYTIPKVRVSRHVRCGTMLTFAAPAEIRQYEEDGTHLLSLSSLRLGDTRYILRIGVTNQGLARGRPDGIGKQQNQARVLQRMFA